MQRLQTRASRAQCGNGSAQPVTEREGGAKGRGCKKPHKPQIEITNYLHIRVLTCGCIDYNSVSIVTQCLIGTLQL